MSRGSCKGRVALVTGSSRGIGKAIALRLAAEGAAVAICSRPQPGLPDLGTLEQARAELEALGGEVAAFTFDLSDGSLDRAALVDMVEDQLGPIDILINNAGTGSFAPFLDWTDDAINAIFELNFWAPWHLVRRTLPGMRERGQGWIVNISSAGAELPQVPPPPAPPMTSSVGVVDLPSWGTVYGGSKALLNRWTVSLAAEVYRDGITVNTMAPLSAAATESLMAYSDIPADHFEPLDTMAEAALALATASPSELSGQITYSLQLLADLKRPVYDLRGEELLDGWQPADLAPRIAQAYELQIRSGLRRNIP